MGLAGHHPNSTLSKAPNCPKNGVHLNPPSKVPLVRLIVELIHGCSKRLNAAPMRKKAECKAQAPEGPRHDKTPSLLDDVLVDFIQHEHG